MAFNLTAGNPRAHRIRVYYTESSTIYEGMPVCYEFDATTNWFGGSVNQQVSSGTAGEITATTTTAEGSQNEGKYIRVEDPDADNAEAFAGVVAKGGWVGKTGPRALDIYIPNGAIVPVRAGVNCTVGLTILAVESGTQYLTVPLETGPSKCVAIAAETVDRSSTEGIVLATLDPNVFIQQTGDAQALVIDDEGTTSSILINRINVKFNNSAIYNRVLYCTGELAGGGSALNGMFKFRTYVNSTLTSACHAVCANLHLKDSGVLPASSGDMHAPLYVSVETEVTSAPPSLANADIVGVEIDYACNESTAAAKNAYMFGVNGGTYKWDGLLFLRHSGDIGDAALSGDVTFSAAGRKIPIKIGDTVYYIPVQPSI